VNPRACGQITAHYCGDAGGRRAGASWPLPGRPSWGRGGGAGLRCPRGSARRTAAAARLHGGGGGGGGGDEGSGGGAGRGRRRRRRRLKRRGTWRNHRPSLVGGAPRPAPAPPQLPAGCSAFATSGCLRCWTGRWGTDKIKQRGGDATEARRAPRDRLHVPRAQAARSRHSTARRRQPNVAAVAVLDVATIAVAVVAAARDAAAGRRRSHRRQSRRWPNPRARSRAHCTHPAADRGGAGWQQRRQRWQRQ